MLEKEMKTWVVSGDSNESAVVMRAVTSTISDQTEGICCAWPC